jgi:hypothetical protein
LHAGLSETAFGTASRCEVWADQVLVEEEMGGVSLRSAWWGVVEMKGVHEEDEEEAASKLDEPGRGREGFTGGILSILGGFLGAWG